MSLLSGAAVIKLSPWLDGAMLCLLHEALFGVLWAREVRGSGIGCALLILLG